MPSLLVSVLIPCYNAARFVGDAIRSAIEQTYDPVEVIVVDDGSDDGSREVIAEFETHRNFRWEAAPHQGGNAARNRLLRLARGDYIQYLDADDLLCPHKVERQMQALDHGADAVLCDYVDFDDNGSPELIHRYSLPSRGILAYVVRHSMITMVPLHRREHLECVGGFDEKLQCCQDFDLHLRLARRVWRRVAHVPLPLCRHRLRPEAISAHEGKIFLQKTQLLRRCCDELNGSSRRDAELSHALADRLYCCARHLVRHGMYAQARDVFRLSKQTCRDLQPPIGWPMRVLTMGLGPVRAERVRSAIVRSRSCGQQRSPIRDRTGR